MAATALAPLRLVLEPSSRHRALEAIEDNLAGFLSAWGRVHHGELEVGADLSRYVTGYPFPLLNGVFGARLGGRHVAERVGDVLAAFRARSLPMIWWVGPTTRPADLGRYLEGAGLQRTEDDVGMALPLGRVGAPPEVPRGLDVRRVTGRSEMRAWVQAAARGFGLPVAMVWALQGLLAGAQDDPTQRYYLGWEGGEPVGTAMLSWSGDSAGLYWVSTVPEARRRGIGTAMASVPLAHAREERPDALAVLHATPMGVGMYRRLGFLEYCRIAHYAWAGDRLQLALGKLALLVGLR